MWKEIEMKLALIVFPKFLNTFNKKYSIKTVRQELWKVFSDLQNNNFGQKCRQLSGIPFTEFWNWVLCEVKKIIEDEKMVLLL